MTKEQLLELLKEERVNLSKFFDFKEKNAELIVVKDLDEDIFYMTILDATLEEAKLLMNRAMEYYDFITPKVISIDEIYDITSLTSAKTLEELFGKMLLIMNGC